MLYLMCTIYREEEEYICVYRYIHVYSLPTYSKEIAPVYREHNLGL